MASRKSIMHPRVEELGGLSPSGLSPVRRRSIIAQKIAPATLVENDDEAELQVRRLEKNVPPAGQTNDRRASLGLSFVSQMSNPQIAEKVQQCIQLSAENKINTKNAFSLQMIDFMTYMIKKKDTNMNNLQVASTSLDVSAKIYGLRVDGIHTDIMKMSDGAEKQDRNDGRRDHADNDDANGADDAETQARERAKKKRKSKQKILVSADALRGPTEIANPTSMLMATGDTQTTDKLDLATIPYHASRGLALYLHNDAVLETIDPAEEGNLAAVSCPIIANLRDLDTCRALAGFEMLGWSVDDEVEEELSATEITAVAENGFQFDLDASLPPEAEHSNAAATMNYFDLEDDEDVAGCERVAQPAANIVDFREVVQAATPRQPNFEYSYFREDMGLQWAGPSHWKFHRPSKHLAGSRIIGRCEQEPIRRKKELIMTLNDEADAVANGKFRKPTETVVTLQAKTARSGWSEEKLTLPQDMHYNAAQTCKYYLSAVMKNFPRQEDATATEVPDEVGDYDYENELDTTDYCPNIDVGEQPETGAENGENGADFETNAGVCTQAFMGDNLVELPKMTQEVVLAFSQRAKKIDMRQLKKCIWKNLIAGSDDKENVDTAERPEAQTGEKVNGEVVFSAVFEELPKTLNKNNIEALSLPIAFISLLHLANEKILQITTINDRSDLAIRQG